MGTTNLNDRVEFFGLLQETLVEGFEAGEESFVNLLGDGNMHGSWEAGREQLVLLFGYCVGDLRIIRGLAHVNVIIRVDGFFAAQLTTQHFDGAVGNDFLQ